MQGSHMAYSLASDAKSFAFCYCCRIARTVIIPQAYLLLMSLISACMIAIVTSLK